MCGEGDAPRALRSALEWHSKGICPIPCETGGKRPLVAWKRYQRGLPSRGQVIEWFRSGNPNLGLIVSDDFFVLDFDDLGRYETWRAEHRRMADTHTVATRRGYHTYYRTDSVVSTMALDGLDVLGAGHLVITAPSLHPSGSRYELVQDGVIRHAELGDVLNWQELPSRSRDLAQVEAPRVNTGRGVIGKIKARLPIVAVLRWYTSTIVPSSRDGRYYVASCPNPRHLDRSPSFWVDAWYGLCSCFKPSCKATQPKGKVMDVINLVSWVEDTSNRDAIKKLAKYVGR